MQNKTMMRKYTMGMNRTSAGIAIGLLLLLLTLPATASGFTLGVFHNTKRVVDIEPSTGMPDILHKNDLEKGLLRIECINSI